MATFEDYIDELLEEEGGSTITDDPSDSGGLTKYGISQKAYPDLDIEALTEEEAKEIYKRDYWDRMHLDDVPEHLRRDLFFAGVNMGIRNPLNRALQEAVGAGADGIIGPNTIKAIKSFDNPEQITRATLREGAIDYYADLAERRPKDKKFINGWMNRALGGDQRPFGSGAIDLRDMDSEEIRRVAKSYLSDAPSTPNLRDVRPNTEDLRSPTEELLTGFIDNLTQLISQRLQPSSTASQELVGARTEPEQPKRGSQALIERGAEMLRQTIERGEQDLERTFNEVLLEETAEDAEREEDSVRRLSLLDRAVEVERRKRRNTRATGTIESEAPVYVNRGTMEQRDASRDPIYGLF